jgi:hypothetical protein
LLHSRRLISPSCRTINATSLAYPRLRTRACHYLTRIEPFVHGYHRATTDIDVLVPATPEEGEKIKAALMVLPDQAAKDLDPAWFAEGDNIRVADAFVVDIMLNACGETYETLQKFAVTIDLEGTPVRTVSLEGLLRTKQTMRDKDISDRHVIERALDVYRQQLKGSAD